VRAVDVVDDGERERRVLAGRLFAIAVPPHRLVKNFEQVGPAAEDLQIPNGLLPAHECRVASGTTSTIVLDDATSALG
jgi:hypothetical protein